MIRASPCFAASREGIPPSPVAWLAIVPAPSTHCLVNWTALSISTLTTPVNFRTGLHQGESLRFGLPYWLNQYSYFRSRSTISCRAEQFPNPTTRLLSANVRPNLLAIWEPVEFQSVLCAALRAASGGGIRLAQSQTAAEYLPVSEVFSKVQGVFQLNRAFIHR